MFSELVDVADQQVDVVGGNRLPSHNVRRCNALGRADTLSVARRRGPNADVVR